MIASSSLNGEGFAALNVCHLASLPSCYLIGHCLII